jgi:diguanylate cyclase (GGDEF)-like protein/PAS domain S-box-containing protein
VRKVALEVVPLMWLLAILSVVHHFGWLGPYSLTVLLPLVSVGQILRVRSINLALAGGDPQRRLWLRLGVHCVLLLAPGLYLTGWGSVALPAFVALISLYVEWTGSRAWWPGVICTLVGTGLGQLGIMFDVLPSYLSKPASMAVWSVGLFGVFKIGQQLGAAAQKYEHSEGELRESQVRAKRGQRWFRALVQNVSDVIMVVDADGTIRYVSPSVQRQLGHQVDEVRTRRFDSSIDPRDAPAARDLWERLINDPDRDHRTELRLLNADGSATWHEIVARNMLADPDINGVVINHRDSHERRMEREGLAYEASHDPLTGLANRAELQRVLGEALLRQAAGAAAVAVLFIDLDGFKPINDRYGHDAGDALLVAVGRLLERSVPGAGTVARVGGDEFVVVLHDAHRADHPENVARRILDNLSAPLHLVGFGEVRVGASIGMAVAATGTTATELLRDADQAMYDAKRQGRDRLDVADHVR